MRLLAGTQERISGIDLGGEDYGGNAAIFSAWGDLPSARSLKNIAVASESATCSTRQPSRMVTVTLAASARSNHSQFQQSTYRGRAQSCPLQAAC